MKHKATKKGSWQGIETQIKTNQEQGGKGASGEIQTKTYMAVSAPPPIPSPLRLNSDPDLD